MGIDNEPHYTPTEGIIWFIRGQCTQCGKLTVPVFANPNGNDMDALGRLRETMEAAGWYVDIYRLFSGPSPGIKTIFRCPICHKELMEFGNKGVASTVTMVTSLASTQTEVEGAQ